MILCFYSRVSAICTFCHGLSWCFSCRPAKVVLGVKYCRGSVAAAVGRFSVLHPVLRSAQSAIDKRFYNNGVSEPTMLTPLLRTALLEPLLAKGVVSYIGPVYIASSHSYATLPSKNSDEKADSPKLGLLALPRKQLLPGQGSFAARFASSSEVTSTAAGENSWTKFRAPYGFEQKSSLGAAMYAAIAVFGFSMYLNDMIYHPPRVVTMLGLMTLLLYVRRH